MERTIDVRSSQIESRVTSVVAWVLAIIFLGFGASKLMASGMQVAMFQAWGYPLWVMYVVGAIEILAGVLLLHPTTAFHGGLLVCGLMAGAVGTHVLAGQLVQLPLPIVTAAAAALVASHRRPNATTRVLTRPIGEGERA